MSYSGQTFGELANRYATALFDLVVTTPDFEACVASMEAMR